MKNSVGIVGASFLSLLAAGCGNPRPSAEVSEWSFARNPSGGYDFSAKATLFDGAAGWFTPILRTIDERGCETTIYAKAAHPVSAPDPAEMETSFQHHVVTEHKVSAVRLVMMYRPSNAEPSDMSADQPVFYQDRVIDAAGPQQSTGPCPRKAGERADGEEEKYGRASSRDETVATFINMAGHLCGRVTDSYRNPDGTITAHCTKTRAGKGKGVYRLDLSGPTVEKIR